MVSSTLCFYPHLLETICKSRYRVIKISVQLLKKNMPLGRFGVLKIPFNKKNVEHSHTERIQKRYQE